jgi:hypothetical protein
VYVRGLFQYAAVGADEWYFPDTLVIITLESGGNTADQEAESWGSRMGALNRELLGSKKEIPRSSSCSITSAVTKNRRALPDRGSCAPGGRSPDQVEDADQFRSARGLSSEVFKKSTRR